MASGQPAKLLPPSSADLKAPQATVVDTPMSVHEAENQELRTFAMYHNLNLPAEIEKFQEKLAMYKGKIPPLKLFCLGVLAGYWVGLATLLAVTGTGGMPSQIRSDWVILPRMMTGFLFPVAIYLIVLFGGELFTGNAMVMCIGLAARRITLYELCYNWFFVLVSNFVGCVASVYFFGYLTHLFDDEPYRSYIKSVADVKINYKPEIVFLRAITANALVCTCVIFSMGAKDMLGKMFTMWFPIMCFAASGFEHAIANMAYVPLGLMYGSTSNWRNWLYQNFLVSVCGNIVGGGFIIGGAQFFLYEWTKGIPAAPRYPEPAAAPAPAPKPLIEDAKVVPLPQRTVPSVDPDRLQQVFRCFDGDADGALNTAEAMCALHVLGFSCSKTIAEGMLAADGNRGGVRYEGFVAVARRMKDLYDLGMTTGIPTATAYAGQA